MTPPKGKRFEVPSTTATPKDDVMDELLGKPSGGSEVMPAVPADTAEHVIDVSRPRMTVYMSRDLQAAVRAAVYWTRNQPEGYENLSDLLEDAAQDMIQRLQERYNDGQPFPPMPTGKRLKRGRPIGS